MKTSTLDSIPALNSSNYRVWRDKVKTSLQLEKLWKIVSGQEKCPSVTPNSTDSSKPLSDTQLATQATEVKLAADWDERSEQAAALMRYTISDKCKIHIRDHEDDPIKIWEILESTFIKQRTAPRFNAYQDLFSLQKDPSESLDGIINRANEQIRIIKSLTPSSFTLDQLYDELFTMAIIRSLPQDFSQVINTIAVLDDFNKDKVITSLRNLDDTNKQLANVLSASSPSFSSSSSNQQKKPNSSPSSSSSKKQQGNRPVCTACDKLGHTEENCWFKKKVFVKVTADDGGKRLSSSD